MGNDLHHIQHVNAQQIQALFQRVAGKFRQLQAAVAGCAFGFEYRAGFVEAAEQGGNLVNLSPRAPL